MNKFTCKLSWYIVYFVYIQLRSKVANESWSAQCESWFESRIPSVITCSCSKAVFHTVPADQKIHNRILSKVCCNVCPVQYASCNILNIIRKLSVCDRGSPIFSGLPLACAKKFWPPLSMYQKTLVPSWPTQKKSGPPLVKEQHLT